ncbi:MAG: tetratricopeptide repeat protein [Chthoniobacterales bacterium]
MAKSDSNRSAGKSFFKTFWTLVFALLWAISLALLLTCVWLLPLFRTQPDMNFVLNASLQSETFLAGLKNFLFDSYGWQGMLTFFVIRQGLVLWGMLALGLSFIFCGAALFLPKDTRKKALLILGLGIILISLGKASMHFLTPYYPVAESLRLPFSILDKAHQAAGERPLYGNTRALRLDKALRKNTSPGTSSRENEKQDSTLWAAAGLNPEIWRKLERQENFGAVLLIGPSSEYQPLLDYLLDASDWRLANLDKHGIIFLPGVAQDWKPKNIPKISTPDDALAVAMTAENLARVRQNGTAHTWLDAAAKAFPNSAPIAARRASFFATRNQWGEALAEANRALEIDSSSLAAMQIKLQALTKKQDMNEAWQVAQELKNAYPHDMHTLFLHSRTANAVGATDAEIDSLLRLISLSESYGLPDEHYRIYLSQCYAKQGIAPLALEQINLALQAPGINDKQRSMLEETREAISASSRLPKN